MNRTEEDEQASPLAPGTMCRATYTFSGVCDVDLPFEEGDEITILEPCNALFWYLAKDKKGNQGVVPVTHIELINNGLVIPLPLPQQTASHSDRSTLPPHSPHSLLRHEDRPPPPLPPPSHQDPHPHPSSDPPIPKYRDMSTFLMKSGWFHPSVDSVLMAKTKFNATELLQKVRTGVYVFIHKAIPNLKYVGKSSDLYHELHRLFDTLYAKSNQQLNPLEVRHLTSGLLIYIPVFCTFQYFVQ
jgi:hypothetical protein